VADFAWHSRREFQVAPRSRHHDNISTIYLTPFSALELQPLRFYLATKRSGRLKMWPGDLLDGRSAHALHLNCPSALQLRPRLLY
jgi:hypothetical protein